LAAYKFGTIFYFVHWAYLLKWLWPEKM